MTYGNMRAADSTIDISTAVGRLCLKKKFSIAVAESCTGGLVGAAITSVAGSSAYFRGGVIAYCNDIKTSVLGVPARVLKRYGAVSAPTVKAMARGARRYLDADCAVAVSGIAGPGGGSREKPVGLVWIGIAARTRLQAHRRIFRGNRKKVRDQATRASLALLVRALAAMNTVPS